MPDMNMQKDLVLSPNEYAYVRDNTKGNVSCWVGPVKTSLSTSDELVRFNHRSKSFEACSYREAISLFTTAPENWYVILKNPIENGRHPSAGTANSFPDNFAIGRKVNITGPVNFALYPGQMAKVVRGHALRSNQYLLARVYEAESANKPDESQGEMVDANGNQVKPKSHNYVNGQILVIKGTEVSFYIPPTGIEVIAVNNEDSRGYVREAVTLERLEYCILKDEDGNKRYVHGPEVVFPEPTETFVTSPKGGFIFKAIELSKISGIYAKVIAEYKDEDGTVHPVGEELFITGNDMMIYYPRPEHAIINYDNKILHHAIAIPEGEGRYIMNRMTGEIKTVVGPAMYLPDPRTEVVVKRKLSARECELYYPGNTAALEYNLNLTEKSVEKSTRSKGLSLDEFTAFCATSSTDSTLANLEAKANISRGTSYTKPRTITLDNKFEGVVSVDVWTGYAVKVTSKSGYRETVCGPKTILLDYDQNLEEVQFSTGKPKTTDHLVKTVFLRYENNKVADIVSVETKDFVKIDIKVSYCVNFDLKYQDKWFDVENYVKFLCDRMRSLMKREAKKYFIEDFYQNYTTIIRNVALGISLSDSDTDADNHEGYFFPENGMYIADCDVLNISVEREIADMLTEHQNEMVHKALELSDATKAIEVAEQLAIAEKRDQELRNQKLLNKMELQRTEALRKLAIQEEVDLRQEAAKKASAEAKKDLQTVLDLVAEAELARKKALYDEEYRQKQLNAQIEAEKISKYAEAVNSILKDISPDLIAAMTAKSNADLTAAIAAAVAPYALASGGESISDVVNKLTRGLPLDSIVDGVNVNI